MAVVPYGQLIITCVTLLLSPVICAILSKSWPSGLESSWKFACNTCICSSVNVVLTRLVLFFEVLSFSKDENKKVKIWNYFTGKVIFIHVQRSKSCVFYHNISQRTTNENASWYYCIRSGKIKLSHFQSNLAVICKVKMCKMQFSFNKIDCDLAHFGMVSRSQSVIDLWVIDATHPSMSTPPLLSNLI